MVTVYEQGIWLYHIMLFKYLILLDLLVNYQLSHFRRLCELFVCLRTFLHLNQLGKVFDMPEMVSLPFIFHRVVFCLHKLLLDHCVILLTALCWVTLNTFQFIYVYLIELQLCLISLESYSCCTPILVRNFDGTILLESWSRFCV